MKMKLVAAAWAVALGATVGAVDLETANLKASFYESPEGKGRICHLVDKRTGVDFVSRHAKRGLWQIECRRTDDYTVRKVVHAHLDFKAMDYSFRRIAHGLQFTYRNVGECLAEVVCTVVADADDGMLRWRIAATPKPGWATYEICYPSVALAESLGASPEDDCISMGSAKGGVTRWPMKPGREYWKTRRYCTSPGHLASPFGCFYDPAAGLYTAAEDVSGCFKGLLIDRWWRTALKDGTFREGDLLLEWRHTEFSPTAYQVPYDVVMRSFHGTAGAPADWRDAADIYRAWAKDRRWNRTKLADRPDVPAWAKNGPVKMKFNRAWYMHPGLVQRWIGEYWRVKFPGVPLVVQTEGWERHGDWVTPEYFPCYPDDASFSRVCADLKAVDGHVWAWPGGHHWNVRVGRRQDGTYRLDYTDLFTREVKPNCVVDPDGTPALKPLVWLGGGDSATLCPATAYGRDWWNDYVSCGLVRRGVGLVQADQDVGARIRSCWSRAHGHAPGDGRWMTEALRFQFESMLARMRRIDPWAQFSFEEPNEFYNDILCFQDYRNCRFFGSEWASVFNYLHHEYVTPYQPGSEFWSKWHWVAHAAADGQMPAFPESPDFYFRMPVLDNGGFEEPKLGLDGYRGWFSGKDEQTIVTNDCTQGRYALGVFSPVHSNVQVWTSIPQGLVASGGTFRVSARLKTLQAGPAEMCVYDPSPDARTFSQAVRPPDPAALWQEVVLDVTAPADAGPKALRLAFRARAGAAFLVDDVKLLKPVPAGGWEPILRRRAGEQLDFAERWARIYHANAKWLQHGCHLHPPRLVCEVLPYRDVFRGNVHETTMPSVFCGAFRAADGTDALFFVNATGRRQDFSYTWKGRTVTSSLAPRELRLDK
ncbi:MAG: DUF6259 domain-containing protein [Kiritimatiellia bacterium]